MAFLDFFCALCLLSFFTETYGTPSNISVSDCHIRLADVVFAMDQSGSVGETFYRIGLQIIADYVRHHIGTGAEKVRVGFTLFDEVGSVALNLKSFTTKNDTADFISHLNYSGGDTNISAGMDAAITVFEQDLNNGSDISRILILITDGADESDVTTQYLRAKKN